MTRRSTSADGPGPAERALIVELTGLVLGQIAPDELVVLDDTAREYFADPAAALRPDGGDTPLGSGITVAMITPYLLATSSVVLPVLGTIAGELGKDIAKDLVKEPVVDRVRRLFKRHPDEPAESDAMSPEQARRVRQVVIAQCHAVGCRPSRPPWWPTRLSARCMSGDD